MGLQKKLLIVDEDGTSKNQIRSILEKKYEIFTEDYERALTVLSERSFFLCATIIRLAETMENPLDYLRKFMVKAGPSKLAVIVIADSKNAELERQALKMGVRDFIAAPFDPDVLAIRVENSIDCSTAEFCRSFSYLIEYDGLTGIYNKSKFFVETKQMLRSDATGRFALFCFDIDRFSLVNSFYGVSVGDSVLVHIADCLREFAASRKHATYGRAESDVFLFCCRCEDEDEIKTIVRQLDKKIKEKSANFNLVSVFGVYNIKDRNMAVSTMVDYANLAAKTVKGNYIKNYAVFNNKMLQSIESEQEIINDMDEALKNDEFCVYLQPKYSLETNKPEGAEALVRWIHPAKGMISPGAFIPVFERSGFIEKLDFHMWEKVCRLIRSWIDRGLKVLPVSVNVSRVNLYNPRFVDKLCALTEKYNIPNELLNLELLENLYVENTMIMQETIEKLHEKGFVVMMDDFGSGYSSLSILKNIDVDVIKIDMRFFMESKIKRRGKNIIAAVIRMAKWLGIPTVAEGVEQVEQVEFLHSIGCEYVQGYYFARPMPVDKYEELINDGAAYKELAERSDDEGRLSLLPQIEVSFDNLSQAVAIYEVVDDNIEYIRVNKAFYKMFEEEVSDIFSRSPIDVVYEDFREPFKKAFSDVIKTRDNSTCEYLRYCRNTSDKWIYLKLKYICRVGNRDVILGNYFDITAQKRIEFELQNYRMALSQSLPELNHVLIVEDDVLNREILKDMFDENYEIFEASSGLEAIDILDKNPCKIDLILLDLFMPHMSGVEFLEYKKSKNSICDIPVIIITSDDTTEQQIRTLSLGANDYITKPFVREVVMRRVNNVLELQQSFKKSVKESRLFK